MQLFQGKRLPEEPAEGFIRHCVCESLPARFRDSGSILSKRGVHLFERRWNFVVGDRAADRMKNRGDSGLTLEVDSEDGCTAVLPIADKSFLSLRRVRKIDCGSGPALK